MSAKSLSTPADSMRARAGRRRRCARAASRVLPAPYSGNANAISSGTRPPPTVSAMYCRPSTR